MYEIPLTHQSLVQPFSSLRHFLSSNRVVREVHGFGGEVVGFEGESRIDDEGKIRDGRFSTVRQKDLWGFGRSLERPDSGFCWKGLTPFHLCFSTSPTSTVLT